MVKSSGGGTPGLRRITGCDLGLLRVAPLGRLDAHDLSRREEHESGANLSERNAVDGGDRFAIGLLLWSIAIDGMLQCGTVVAGDGIGFVVEDFGCHELLSVVDQDETIDAAGDQPAMMLDGERPFVFHVQSP